MLKRNKVLFIAIIFSCLFLSPVFSVRAGSLDSPFSEPSKILIDNLTNRIFALNFKSNEITVFDGMGKKVVANISSGGIGLVNGEIIEEKNGERSLYVVNEWSKNIVRFPGLASKEHLDSASIQQILDEKTFIKMDFSPAYFFSDGELQKLYIVGPKDFLIIDNNTQKTTVFELGQKPGGKAAFDPTTHRVYVFNRGEGRLFIIDGEKEEITQDLFIMAGNTFGAMTGASDNFFVSSREGDILVLGMRGETIATIKPGSRLPIRMSINYSTEKLYVGNQGDFSISVISLKSYAVLKKISLPIGTIPGEILIDSNSNLIFVSNGIDNSVSIIDGKNDEVITTLKIGISPGEAVINSATGEVYIPNRESNSISIVSKTSDGQFQEQTIPNQKEKIQTGENLSYPFRLIFNEAQNELYILNNKGGNFLVVDGRTYKIKDKVLVGQNPTYFVFIPELNKIFIAVKNEDKIVSYNVLSKSKKTISVGHYPGYLFFNPQTKRLYVDNYGSRDLSIVDAENDAFLYDLPLEGALIPIIVLNPRENKIYTVSLENNELIIIDGKDDKVLKRIKFEKKISNVFFDEAFNRLYVTSRASDEIIVIDGADDQIIKELNNPPLTSNIGRIESDFMGGVETGGRVFLGLDEKIIMIDSESLDINQSVFRINGTPIKIIIDESKQVLYALTVRGNLHIFDVKEGSSNNLPLASLDIFKAFSELLPGYLDVYSRGALNDFGKSVLLVPRNNKLFVNIPGADIVAIVSGEDNGLEAVITNDGLKMLRRVPPSIAQYFPYIIIICFFIIFGLGGFFYRRKRKKSNLTT